MRGFRLPSGCVFGFLVSLVARLSCRVGGEAIRIYECLAETEPAFLHGLTAALNNQSVELAALGRPEEALAASQEVVTFRRDLAPATSAACGLTTSSSPQPWTRFPRC